MLTRRAFAGGVACTICGLVDLAGTGAAAQEGRPRVGGAPGPAGKIDPRIRRILRSRTNKAYLDRDIARGRVELASVGGRARPKMSALVLFKDGTDEVPGRLDSLGDWKLIAGRIYAVDLPLDDLERLESDPDVEYVEEGGRVRDTVVTSRTETGAAAVQAPQGGVPGLTGEGVIVGIIDSDLDFTLDDFRDETGTRVLFLWDQRPPKEVAERPPAGFDFGVEYSAADINEMLQAEKEKQFARMGREPKPASHGTHVAGIAVGNGRSHDAKFPAGRYVGIAPKAKIVFVHGTSSQNDKAVNLVRAVKYIFEKADKLGMPCVINISKGSNGGSHDGQSLVEQAFDRMLEQKPGRALVKSAGNLHDRSMHRTGTLRIGEQRLTWRVHEDDRTDNEVEIWYSSRDYVRVRLTNPRGRSTPSVAPGRHIEREWDGVRISIESVRSTGLNGDAQIFIGVDPASGEEITPGDWIIELDAQEIDDGRYHAWIERDDHNSKDQSYFVHSDGERWKSDGETISFPGTGYHTITVANYEHLHVPVRVHKSSGRGRTRDDREKPEVAAPGTAIVSSCAMGGRRRKGVVCPVRVAMTGTSMAAPHVAGAIALILQRHPQLTAQEIRHALIETAMPVRGADDFDEKWGYGRLDIAACLEHLEKKR